MVKPACTRWVRALWAVPGRGAPSPCYSVQVFRTLILFILLVLYADTRGCSPVYMDRWRQQRVQWGQSLQARRLRVNLMQAAAAGPVLTDMYIAARPLGDG